MTDNDLPLFENDTHGQPSDRVFVISSNYTLAPLFSRGCLLPPIFGEKTQLEYFDAQPTQLPLATKQISASISRQIENSARNAYPIAVEIVSEKHLTTLRIKEAKQSLPILSINASKRILFRTQEELARFSSASFGDFETSNIGIELVVDEDIFEPVDSAIS